MAQFELLTERLVIRRFELADIAFIQAHYNEPGFIANIGDKNIRNDSDAIAYLTAGPFKNYNDHGFGLFLITLKDSGQPIGTCGLITRAMIENVDLGYSLSLPYPGNGYLHEAAVAVLDYAEQQLAFEQVVAYTSHQNVASIRALTKLNFESCGEFALPGYEQSSKYFIKKFS